MSEQINKNSYLSNISNFLQRGDIRSVRAKKNTLFLALIKVISILTSLLLVPITINYVSSASYGIWLTISSMVVWFSFFDIGLTNGMRNKLTEAIATGKGDDAKGYVSTTYFSLLIISFVIWVIFIIVNHYLDWSKILNLEENISVEIHTLVFIVFTYFCIQFFLKIINTVSIACQQPARAALVDVAGQLLALLIIFILTKTTQGSLIYLGLGLTIAPIVILIAANVILFNTTYKKYAPSISFFNSKYLKNLFALGGKFFVIQIAALIQYQTANFIIARNYNTESVTDYNVAYKYFSILLMGFAILLAPFWSAATDAYAKNDYDWIKRAVKRYVHVFFLFVLAGLIMLGISSFVYDIWIGKDVVSISFAMSLCCFLYVITTTFGSIYVNLLNGIGAIKIQFYCSLITPTLFILLCLFFINQLNWGVYCIFIASILSNLNGIVLAPIQYRKIFIEKRGGIWEK